VTPFEVLAEPNRRLILDLLRDGDRPVGELVGALRLSQPAVSKHLRVLRDAGLVEVRAEAQRRHYRLRAAPLAEVDGWLEPYRRYWLGRLDSLERHLDAVSSDVVSLDAGSPGDVFPGEVPTLEVDR
jgi:DNA-binding transcriptional ArsR family regulator